MAPRELTGPRSHERPSARGRRAWFRCNPVPQRIEADAFGFDLGPHATATRYRSKRWSHVLTFEGNSEVRIRLDAKTLTAAPLVALTLSRGLVRDRVRLADGRSVEEAGYALEAWCEAVPVEGDRHPWFAAAVRPIHIVVRDRETQKILVRGEVTLEGPVLCVDPEDEHDDDEHDDGEHDDGGGAEG